MLKMLPAKYTSFTVARLRELLHYEPTTGIFTRVVGRRGAAKAGDVAGCLHPNGYIYICVDGKRYMAHRLAHLYMVGAWPPAMIDHRDNCKHNNTWANLRPATGSENQLNASARKNNKLGQKNISKNHGSYTVTVQGVPLGCSTDLDTAIAWRDFAVEFCAGDFARI